MLTTRMRSALVLGLLAAAGAPVPLPAAQGSLLMNYSVQGDQPTAAPTAEPYVTLPPAPGLPGSVLTAGAGSLPAEVYSASTMPLAWDEVAGSVTVITSAELSARHVQTVPEALQSVPGLDVVAQGGPGQLTSVFIRGAASNQTLLMVNGMEINNPIDPGRGADISKLTVDNVDRIEIVRGPQSSVYGSGAMGGVINIITRKQVKTWQGEAAVEGGKYSTWLGRANAAGSLGDVDLALGTSWTGTQGFSAARRTLAAPQPLPDFVTNVYHNFTEDLNVGYQATPNLAFRLMNRHVQGESQLDNFGGDFGDAAGYWMDFLQEINRLETTLDLLDKTWQQKFSIGSSFQDRTTRNDPGAPLPVVHTRYRSRVIDVDWRNQIHGVVAGVSYRQEQGDYDDETFLAFGSNPVFAEHSEHVVGVYLEDEFHLEDVALDAGVRWDTHDQYGSVTTYRLSPVYVVRATGTRVKGGLSTAFNAPSLDQLYSDFGNPKLKPETSTGWEVGAEQKIMVGAVVVGATYFQTDFSDQITSDPATFKYVNLKKVSTRGWEVTLAITPLADLDVRASYTKLTANDLTLADTTGPQTLIRRADYKFGLDAAYRFGGATCALSATRVGPRYDLDFNSFPVAQVSLAPYTLVNLSLAYAVTEQWEIYTKINNLLDTDYTEVLGYNTPRFEAFAGAKFRWK